ncbi:MAG: PAS domain-containing protein [Rhizomicrobium sp.]
MVEGNAPGERYTQMAQENGWVGLCDPTLNFRAPELLELCRQWHELKGSGEIPKRADFTPRVLKNSLPHLAIYECVNCPKLGKRYRVRLMGTRFADVMGDLTGKFVDEAVAPQFLPRWYAALDAVLEARAPLRFLSRSDTMDKKFLLGEFFEAPLLSDSGEPSLVLAAGIYSPMRSWKEVLNQERARAVSVAA